jgi:acyl-CoA thioester hydrolase
VIISQDVIWGDMDAYGHVNNTVYFRYFEDARMAFFEKAGVAEHKEQSAIGPILAATHCNFRLPLDYPDRIHIAVRARILSPKKINLEYAVFSESRGAIAADGESLVVYYDYAQGRSCEIPEAISAVIEALYL